MNIAFISLQSGLPWGGSEALWHKTALHAKQQGHNISCSVYNWRQQESIKIKELEQAGIEIHRRPHFNPGANIIQKTILHFRNRIPALNHLYKPIFDFRPDIIVINQGDSFDISVHHYTLYQQIKKSGIQYILICHSHSQYSDIPQNNIYPQAVEIFENAKHVCFVSNRMKSITERRLCTNLTNAKIIWNPLNIKSTEYLKYPLNTTSQFAIVGSMIGGKGHDTLLEVLSAEVWQHRKWQLYIYGKGDGEKYIAGLAQYYNISNKINFCGYVNDIFEVWKQNHILLIPSAGEGLPISLCEAMICGRPAIVTDVGGNTEMITEGETGFIAEAPSVYSYSKAMERAWQNKDKWEEMGKSAHEFALKTVDIKAEKTLLGLII